ncbi:CRISPR-associated RAMP Csm5 family protein [Vulcanisaeta distributa]|uniref:CRISPR-associated RAMP Csm5 family protein n=1 Tax=Vulcanisaeta distributa (strain DSM 14429 / JCM 11212 / NBRC 100878 / IC-017) TaxID=572478 RepID=E1QQW8_VULDI|nr:CRISPR-associated RAMP Csm5 family protein [Vulcanisaeta distributa]ADN50538.1 CRISPR-associated RAMP Csm5 family protein [Vulcanisaeta distributa DSM 14429]
MRLVINVKTPTFVLSGGRLSIGLDAVASGGRLYVIDLTKLPIEQLVNVKSMDYGQLLNALMNTMSKAPERYSVRSYAIVTNCGGVEVLDHSPEGIPPSEVKGLIRTAYLYWLLARDAQLRESFTRAVSEKLAERPRLNMVSPEAEDDVLTVVMERIHGEERLKAPYRLFKDLAVRQLTKPRPDDYGVYCIHDREDKYRVMAIGLRPGVRLEYEVAIRHPPVTEDVKARLLNYDDIVNAIKEFSREVSSFEGRRGLKVPECGGGVPVRVGFGASRRWKTVINLLEKYSPDLVSRITDYVSSRLNRPWGDATVRLAGNEPIGWVCIEVRQGE